MRLRLTLASLAILALVIACGCGKKEEPTATKKAAAPEPGWPAISVQDAAVQYDLEEAHYHMRKGRVMAGSGWGAQTEAPIAQGYVQWAYEMQPDNDHAADAAGHLTRQAGSVIDPAFSRVARCRACGYTMPASVSTWRWTDDHKAKRTTECPSCLAEDSFPNSLILYCGKCRNMVAGSNAAGPYCTNCNQSWEGFQKICGSCGKSTSLLAHAGQRCPACKARWNREIPFGDPTAMKTAVNFSGNQSRNDDFVRVHMEVTPHGPRFTTSWFDPKPVQCSGYTAFTGQRCPNKTQRFADGGKAYCGVHRHQAERDAIIARGPVAIGGAAAGGMGGGMAGPGMPGAAPGMSGGVMPGGGMPGAAGPGGAAGGKADAGSNGKSEDKKSSAKAPKSADGGEE